jgi:hypothetical protein
MYASLNSFIHRRPWLTRLTSLLFRAGSVLLHETTVLYVGLVVPATMRLLGNLNSSPKAHPSP